MGLLDGKVIIVSGSARGQGAADCKLFVEEGARVLVSDMRDEEGEAVAASLGDAALYRHLDVGDEQQWKEAVKAVDDRWGRIDGLVNNAGLITSKGRMVDISPDAFQRDFNVHMLGAFFGMRSVAPSMKRGGGGSIVNITSIAAHSGVYGDFGYGATKWGLRGMTRTAAIELGPMNIRVNAVAPGVIDVSATFGEDSERYRRDLAALGYDVENPSAWMEWKILDRTGRPEEIAFLVGYLLSDRAAFLTAQEYLFDCGTTSILAAPPRERWSTELPEGLAL